MRRLAPSPMVDTMVLINAIRCPEISILGSDDSDDARCRHLLSTLPVIRVSAITWLEVKRKMRDEERPEFERLSNRCWVHPIDAEVVDAAIDIMKSRIKVWGQDYCGTCNNPASEKKCGGCGNLVNVGQRWNDYLVAATAHIANDDVSELYSLDAKVLNLNGQLRVKVIRPASIHGPMFEGSVMPAKTGPAKTVPRPVHHPSQMTAPAKSARKKAPTHP